MTYRGFQYAAEFNGTGQPWTGRVINTSERIEFEADTYGELDEAFREAVDDYLYECDLLGIEPQREASI